MYTLTTPLTTVTGVGKVTAKIFAKNDLHTVKDLLLYLPFRYVDRSQLHSIATAPKDTEVSLKGRLSDITQFYKNKRKIVKARLTDDTGSLTLMWFNAKFIKQTLQTDTEYFVSGKISSTYRSITQPTVEKATADTIHTNRMVPVYSTITGMKQGVVRRLLKKVCDNLQQFEDGLTDNLTRGTGEPQLAPTDITHLFQSLKQLHFPDDKESIIAGRRRLALEELLAVIEKAEQTKNNWNSVKSATQVQKFDFDQTETWLPNLPFTLTNAQLRSTKEILTDLAQPKAMNRLLIGDVGSGKTVVAGIAAEKILEKGSSVFFIAPTKILAGQHEQSLKKMFPQLGVELVTGTKKILKEVRARQVVPQEPYPKLYVGTHTLINRLDQVNPGLVIYDEQHRFGVAHRSKSGELETRPHILTMTATPIPRSLVLTLFAHLSLSVIDELPPGRIPTTTWLVTEKKRKSGYQWIADQVQEKKQQALVICPFVDPSRHLAFENVSAATDILDELKQLLKGKRIRFGLLHGRQKKKEQEDIIAQMYAGKIDVLVTTPIVEVGVDLPQASFIAIEAAERFGLASLHQLRGRVGRAGQESFCLLFTTNQSHHQSERLKIFTKENNGLKLAEADLEHRGSGDMFGVQQSGFSQLKFGSWNDAELLAFAKKIHEDLPSNWKPFLELEKGEEKVLGN